MSAKAQRGSSVIPAELSADRAVPAHCAGTALSLLRSPLWGDRMQTERLSVCIRSVPPDGRKIGFLPSAKPDPDGRGWSRTLADAPSANGRDPIGIHYKSVNRLVMNGRTVRTSEKGLSGVDDHCSSSFTALCSSKENFFLLLGPFTRPLRPSVYYKSVYGLVIHPYGIASVSGWSIR